MKKIIALVIALTVLSFGSLCMIGSIVNSQKDNVTITENVIFGDRSYAEGLKIFTRAKYDGRLFWNTSYTIGGSASTEYEFHYNKYYEYGEMSYAGLDLGFDFAYGVNSTASLEDLTGIERAYRELADATKPGAESTKHIYLQDYYDYYPIAVSVYLPGILWQGNDYERLAYENAVNEKAVWDKFREFFKIPLPDDLPGIDISVGKDSRGNVVSVGSGGESSPFYSHSTYTDTMCFFSIMNKYTNENSESKYYDTSLIPGGYGIYAFDYENVRDTSNTYGSTTVFKEGYETGIKEETLRLVYPIEQDVEVMYLSVSEDGSKLLIFTEENGSTYLNVVDTETFAELQRFKVANSEVSAYYEYDNFIVLEEYQDDVDISVIEICEDGTYRLVFSVPRSESSKNYSIEDMAFNGRELAIITKMYNENQLFELCGFLVSVYNSSGLVYYGEYESSLSLNQSYIDYSARCLPVRIEISWK